MKDKVTIAIQDNVRIYVSSTKEIIKEAVERHNLWPVAAQSLSRVLSVTSIMGQMLKQKQKIVSIINGGGILGTIMAESDFEGNIRGYVANPSLDLKYNKDNKLAVAHAIGNKGYLKVIKDVGMKEAFTTQVSMIDGEIGSEFTHYFYQSEQTKTAVLVGCILGKEDIIQSSGALVIQLLPNHKETDVEFVENKLNEIKSFSTLLKEKTTEEIVALLFPDATILENKNIRFKCKCDNDKMLNAIKTLGKNVIAELIDEGKCEIKCQYCSEIKIFTKKELEKLI